MAKRKLILDAHKEWDMSGKGILFEAYSYTNPGPWVAKILEYVDGINNKLKEKGTDKKKLITCYISKNDGPHCELTFKGPKKLILETINFYLGRSKILQHFTATIK
jgi:hypothetical protein